MGSFIPVSPEYHSQTGLGKSSARNELRHTMQRRTQNPLNVKSIEQHAENVRNNIFQKTFSILTKERPLGGIVGPNGATLYYRDPKKAIALGEKIDNLAKKRISEWSIFFERNPKKRTDLKNQNQARTRVQFLDEEKVVETHLQDLSAHTGEKLVPLHAVHITFPSEENARQAWSNWTANPTLHPIIPNASTVHIKSGEKFNAVFSEQQLAEQWSHTIKHLTQRRDELKAGRLSESAHALKMELDKSENKQKKVTDVHTKVQLTAILPAIAAAFGGWPYLAILSGQAGITAFARLYQTMLNKKTKKSVQKHPAHVFAELATHAYLEKLMPSQENAPTVADSRNQVLSHILNSLKATTKVQWANARQTQTDHPQSKDKKSL
jgi:hypothetical protein